MEILQCRVSSLFGIKIAERASEFRNYLLENKELSTTFRARMDCIAINFISVSCASPRSVLAFVESKKGTALTIPCSGEPERPRRSNYHFNWDLVGQKTLFKVHNCEDEILNIYLHLYYIKL